MKIIPFGLRHLLFLPVFILRVAAQDYDWRTMAGSSGGAAFADGSAGRARFSSPAAVAADGDGTLYIADSGNHVIRRMTADGTVSLLAGWPGVSGHTDGPGRAARFSQPGGLTVDGSGNVIVADTGNYIIRKITPQGEVTTLAGIRLPTGGGFTRDGPAAEASFSSPVAVAAGSSGEAYVVDSKGLIRVISPGGMVTTLAGGTPGGIIPVPIDADGTGTAARFSGPSAIAPDGAGNFIIADTFNAKLRRITPQGVVTSLSTGRRQPVGVTVDRSSGRIYFAERNTHLVYEALPGGGAVRLAGGGQGFADGDGPAARLNFPLGLAWDGVRGVVAADRDNHALRRISFEGRVSTLAGRPASVIADADGSVAVAQFFKPAHVVSAPGGMAYVCASDGKSIRRTGLDGMVSTLAGGSANVVDGTGGAAGFQGIGGLAVDAAGMIYVSDVTAIRRVTPAGEVTTLAGQPGKSGFVDGTGAAARFLSLAGLAVDAAGNLIAADREAHTIRRVTPGGVVTTIAGSATLPGRADGPGSFARFLNPGGVAVDGEGRVFVADTGNHTIRRIEPDGTVRTFAGLAGSGLVRDGPRVAARFYQPGTLAIDGAGNLFVAGGGSRIRMIRPDGEVRTIGGVFGAAGNADGLDAAALFNNPLGLAVNAAGTLFIADTDNHRIVTGTPVAAPDIAVEDASGSEVSASLAYSAGNAGVNGSASSLEFVIRNRGNSDLTGLALRFTGKDAGDFSLAQNPGGAPLPPGGSLPVTVLFHAPVPGTKSALLAIDSNDTAENPVLIPVTGTAVAAVPALVLYGPSYPLPLRSGLSFGLGNMDIGTTSSRMLTLRNAGSVPLTGISLTLDGVDPRDFSAAVTLAEVPAFGSMPLIVEFHPSSEGEKRAVLHIASNDPVQPVFDLLLQGTALPAGPKLTIGLPPGEGLSGATPALIFTPAPGDGVKTIAVRNAGQTRLTDLAVQVEGPQAGGFVIGPPAVRTLAPGESVAVSVTFSPSGNGWQTATLRVRGTGAADAIVVLAGRSASGEIFRSTTAIAGAPGSVTVSGLNGPVYVLRLLFPAAYVPDLASRDFWLMAPDGRTCLVLSDSYAGSSTGPVSLAFDDNAPAAFTNSPNTGSGTFRPADQSYPPNVDMPPPGVTGDIGTSLMSLAASVVNGTWRLFVREGPDDRPFTTPWALEIDAGPVVPVPWLKVDELSGNAPFSRTFEQVIVGDSATMTFTVRNCGDASLTGVSAILSESPDFSMTRGLPPEIDPGGTAAMEVRFTPSLALGRFASLTIVGNDAGRSPLVISLSGSGLEAEIAVHQPPGTNLQDGAERELGSVVTSASVVMEFTVRNYGNTFLTGLGIEISGPQAAEFTVVTAPVAPLAGYGGQTAFAVRFSPAAEGLRTATLRIASNDADESPFDILLRGHGVPAPLHEIVVEQPEGTDLSRLRGRAFGSVPVGSSASRTFTIRNTGVSVLAGITITDAGANGEEFPVSQPAAALAPGASTSFTVTFTPAAPGLRVATVRIASNDEDDNPYDIAVSGSGYAPLPEISVECPAGVGLTGGSAEVLISVPTPAKTAQRCFTVRNRGTLQLTNLAASLTGGHAEDFRVLQPLPESLGPGQSAEFTVLCRAAFHGSRSAVLRVTSSDADEASFDIQLYAAITVSREIAGAGGFVINSLGSATPPSDTVRLPLSDWPVFSTRVRFSGLIHTFASDIMARLYRGSGDTFPLMVNAGGDLSVFGANIVFDDYAATALPTTTALMSGTYRPTGLPNQSGNYGQQAGAGGLSAWLWQDPGEFISLQIGDDTAGEGGSLDSWAVELEVPEMLDYPGWAAEHGLTGAAALAEHDADGDGLANLIEFAAGSDPRKSSPADHPSVQVVGDRLEFTFSRDDMAEGDAVINVQWSVDLVEWLDLDASREGESVSVLENGWGRDLVTASIPRGNSPRIAMRLKVVRLP